MAELVAISGFFLPWSQHSDSFLQVIRMTLPGESSGLSAVSIYYPIAFLLSLAAGLISFLFLLLGHMVRFAWIRSLRLTALLSSLMMAGPLVYIQPWRFSGADEARYDLQELIESTNTGWTLTLVGSLLVVLVAIYMFHRRVRSDSPIRSSRISTSITRERLAFSSLVFPLLLIMGLIAMILGSLLTWITGVISSPWFGPYAQSWSVYGTDIVGPITIVLAVTTVAVSCVLISQFIGKAARNTVRLIAENALVLSLGLTVFFCFTFPVHWWGIEVFFYHVRLQIGLYLSVVGQLLLFTSLIVQDWRQFVSSRRDVAVIATNK